MEDGKWAQEKEFVKKHLEESGGDKFSKFGHTFRSRYTHSMRVLKWVHRLAEDFPKANLDIMELAAIFHDVGYGAAENESHPTRGAELFHQYGVEQGMESEFMKKVETLILEHTEKYKMNDEISQELLFLMEADLMDEEGALRIAWDCMAEGMKAYTSFEAAYQHTLKFYRPANPMITPKARAYWEEKEHLIQEYLVQFERDLEED
ncbi:MAG: HD domain-containing protein [Lachnospiraceae bacterium]